jgi:hypothetical protein
LVSQLDYVLERIFVFFGLHGVQNSPSLDGGVNSGSPRGGQSYPVVIGGSGLTGDAVLMTSRTNAQTTTQTNTTSKPKGTPERDGGMSCNLLSLINKPARKNFAYYSARDFDIILNQSCLGIKFSPAVIYAYKLPESISLRVFIPKSITLDVPRPCTALFFVKFFESMHGKLPNDVRLCQKSIILRDDHFLVDFDDYFYFQSSFTHPFVNELMNPGSHIRIITPRRSNLAPINLAINSMVRSEGGYVQTFFEGFNPYGNGQTSFYDASKLGGFLKDYRDYCLEYQVLPNPAFMVLQNVDLNLGKVFIQHMKKEIYQTTPNAFLDGSGNSMDHWKEHLVCAKYPISVKPKRKTFDNHDDFEKTLSTYYNQKLRDGWSENKILNTFMQDYNVELSHVSSTIVNLKQKFIIGNNTNFTGMKDYIKKMPGKSQLSKEERRNQEDREKPKFKQTKSSKKSNIQKHINNQIVNFVKDNKEGKIVTANKEEVFCQSDSESEEKEEEEEKLSFGKVLAIGSKYVYKYVKICPPTPLSKFFLMIKELTKKLLDYVPSCLLLTSFINYCTGNTWLKSKNRGESIRIFTHYLPTFKQMMLLFIMFTIIKHLLSVLHVRRAKKITYKVLAQVPQAEDNDDNACADRNVNNLDSVDERPDTYTPLPLVHHPNKFIVRERKETVLDIKFDRIVLLEIPYWVSQLDITVDAEITTQILHPKNNFQHTKPGVLMERISRSIGLGSGVNLDRYDIFIDDINNNTVRFGLGVLLHHRCKSIETNLFRDFQDWDHMKLVPLWAPINQKLPIASKLVKKMAQGVSRATISMATGLQRLSCRLLRIWMKPVLPLLRHTRPMIHTIALQLHALLLRFYQLFPPNQTQVIRTILLQVFQRGWPRLQDLIGVAFVVISANLLRGGLKKIWNLFRLVTSAIGVILVHLR